MGRGSAGPAALRLRSACAPGAPSQPPRPPRSGAGRGRCACAGRGAGGGRVVVAAAASRTSLSVGGNEGVLAEARLRRPTGRYWAARPSPLRVCVTAVSAGCAQARRGRPGPG